jgi:hypothetical protein
MVMGFGTGISSMLQSTVAVELIVQTFSRNEDL